MKKITCLFVILMLLISLSSCSLGISGDEAKEFINEFFQAIEKEDYDTAKTFLHPERPADLQIFFEGVESSDNVDFSSIVVEKYTGVSSAVYDSTVGGSTYSLSMDISASGKTAEVEVELVKNDNGFGIYNFDIDVD